MKIIPTTAFMGRSKIYSSISKEDATGIQTRLLASTTRKNALTRLGVDVKINSAMTGNASANVGISTTPHLFDSDWVNSIKHQLKNDYDLRGISEVFECETGELWVVFNDDVDLRKVINPMWRGIQAWNLTMLVFDRIDEEKNALIYIQRAGTTNNHKPPSEKTSDVTQMNKEHTDPEPNEVEPATNPVEVNSATGELKQKNADIIGEKLTNLKAPRGIGLENVEVEVSGNIVRLEGDIKRVNSTAVDYDLLVTIKVGADQNQLECRVGTSEEVGKSFEGNSVVNVVRDAISRQAKAELEKSK